MDDEAFTIDANGVPHAYRQAVLGFAENLKIDGEALLRGERLECNGLGFWLEHYGQQDPRGMTVFVDLGEFPPEKEAVVCRRLLEHNVLNPGALYGYFGVIPETNCAVFAVRLALDQVDNGGEALAYLIASLVQGIDKMQLVLTQAIEHVQLHTTH